MPPSRAVGRLCAPLLDRLADDAPDQRQEAGDAIGITHTRWREVLLRDVRDLLNTTQSIGTTRPPGFPVVAGRVASVHASVLGFGLPALAGRPVASCDVEGLADALAHALRRFEPRLVPGSVRVAWDGRHEGTLHLLRFLIEAQIRTRPVPATLLIRTEIDVDSGHARVEEAP